MIAYEQLGAGLPIVLLHGHTLDRRMWADTAPTLAAAGFRVILPDMAGHGQSGPSAPGSTPADDLVELLDALAIPQAVLAGLSLGGAVAINFALRFPERCAGLVPIDAALFGYRFTEWPGTKPYVQMARDGAFAAALEAWLGDPLFATALTSPAAEAIRTMVRAFPGEGWATPAVSPVPPGAAPDAERLATVAAPTLVLVGEHDLPDFRRISAKLAAEIPGAVQQVIADAGHLLPLEQPARFVAVLRPFLDALASR